MKKLILGIVLAAISSSAALADTVSFKNDAWYTIEVTVTDRDHTHQKTLYKGQKWAVGVTAAWDAHVYVQGAAFCSGNTWELSGTRDTDYQFKGTICSASVKKVN